ncbi:MAG: DUF4167 domain-containing protein [Kiloniellales bacterium]|nr:DUF4167 domain-containing protein [Kiloniellales bacterium]
MRQQPSGRRPRGRSNRKHYVPHRSQNYDSHGPDVRVRGNAMQVYEKYVNLARDAASSGDRIAAESYQQYAEHYYRIINDTTDPQRPPQQTAGSAGAERAGVESAEGEQGSPERGARARQKDARAPYPMDAEQPFVDGEAPAGASTPAPRAAAEGNGQAPEAGPAAEEGGETPVDGGGDKAGSREEAKPKPRGRGRPRARAKAGNGAAAKDESEETVAPASGETSKAGEPGG